MSANSSDICSCGNSPSYNICPGGHRKCIGCIRNWACISSTNEEPLKCPGLVCTSLGSTAALVDLLGKTNFLFPLNRKLQKLGIILSFCYQCKIVVNLRPEINKIMVCTDCGARICTKCALIDHSDYTCFYSLAEEEYKEISLTAPANHNNPVSALEREWLRVFNDFNTSITPADGIEFQSAKLIVNKPLERRYLQRKLEMASHCGGIQNVSEVYFWHGSKSANYPSIMREGLKVGEVDGIPVVNGKGYGYGIYSATTIQTPKGYASDSCWVGCFVGLKGTIGSAAVTNPTLLRSASAHSFVPPGQKDWIIFFTKEQVLPRFLVEYKKK